MGAPLGNTNAADGLRYKKALERALAHKHGSVDDGLFALAKSRIKRAIEDEDGQAAQDIADRFDGKPSQAVQHSGPGGEPITILVREIVRAPD